MSNVLIEFFGNQRIIAKADSIAMPLSEGAVAGDALEYVRSKYPGLPLDGGVLLITVNHEVVTPDRLLKANDVIGFVPHVGGG